MPKMSNYDRIRNMSVEELAEFFDEITDCPCITICNNFERCNRNNAIEPICKNHYKQWLEMEVEE